MTATAQASGATATPRPRGGVRPEHANWLAAALPIAVAWWVFARYGVPARDLAAFTAYVALVLTLPGTVVWTLVRGPQAPRLPRYADLALGTVVGLLLESPLYLACRHVGRPRLLWLWPVLVVALVVALLVVSAERRRRGGGAGAPPWGARLPRPTLPAVQAWVLALLVVYVVLAIDQQALSTTSLQSLSLRTPSADEPFHLALIGELRHHVPGEMPFVAGTPLDYHWLVYAHIASASWLTGATPVVLLRTLVPALLIVVTVLAASAGAVAVSRRTWTGPATAAVLVLVSTLDVYGWTPLTEPWGGQGALDPLQLYLSPTYVYSGTLLVVPVVLTLLWLGGGRDDQNSRQRSRLGSQVALLVLFAAGVVLVGGAKSTTLPVLGAGLVGAAGLQWVLHRRPPVRLLVLVAVTGVGFWVDKMVFYGPGARSLTFDPLAPFARVAVQNGLAPDVASVPWSYLLVMAGVWLLVRLVASAGAVGLLVRGGWREPTTQVLLGASAAGLGAALLLDHPYGGQFYFAHVTHVPLALASVLGIARLIREGDRAAAVAAAAATAGGLLVGLLLPLGFSSQGPIADYWSTFVVPIVVAAVAVALALLLAHLVRRRVGASGVSLLMVGVVMLTAMASTSAVGTTARMVTGDRDRPEDGTASIAEGGLAAARWLKHHSGPDDLVATNAHCKNGPVPNCDRRHFWISGYTERRVLVEGWAYVSPQSVGLPSNATTNSNVPPFWDPARILANDQAFTDPTPTSLGVLASRYDVTWLFVDEQYRPDERGLDRFADRVFHAGDFTVYRLRR